MQSATLIAISWPKFDNGSVAWSIPSIPDPDQTTPRQGAWSQIAQSGRDSPKPGERYATTTSCDPDQCVGPAQCGTDGSCTSRMRRTFRQTAAHRPLGSCYVGRRRAESELWIQVTSSLVLQLAVSAAAVALSVLIHLSGILALIRLMRLHTRRWMTRHVGLNQATIILGAAFGLFVLHAAEIWLYASLYAILGAAPDFEQALYFSISTYATIGYGDLTLGRAWRVLGAIEGINGIILLGWSTAFFISIVERLKMVEHDWLEPSRPEDET